MVAKPGDRFKVRLEIPQRSTGDSVDQFVLWVRGNSLVATARARTLDIFRRTRPDVYLTVDGKVVEDEWQQPRLLPAVAAESLSNRV